MQIVKTFHYELKNFKTNNHLIKKFKTCFAAIFSKNVFPPLSRSFLENTSVRHTQDILFLYLVGTSLKYETNLIKIKKKTTSF